MKLQEQLRGRNVPDHLMPPLDNYKLEALFDEHFIFILTYHCPLCNAFIRKRPKEHFALRDLAAQLFEAIGYPDDYAEKGFVVPEDGDVWSGVFPRNTSI